MNCCPLGARPESRSFPARNIGPATAAMRSRKRWLCHQPSGTTELVAFISRVATEDVKVSRQSSLCPPPPTAIENRFAALQSISIVASTISSTAAPK
jgi:hypothetical protein